MTNIASFPNRRREPEPDELARAHMTNARLHKRLDQAVADLAEARSQRDEWRVRFWLLLLLLPMASFAIAALAGIFTDSDMVAIKRDAMGAFWAWVER